MGLILGILVFLIAKILLPKILINTEKIGVAGKYTPEKLPEDILSLISSGLTYIDNNGEVNPSIAESWETTDGGKTWTFKIKKDLLWQDGQVVDTNSINYQFNDAKTEKPDPSTIIFKLDTPFSAFPTIVSKPIFKKGLLGTAAWKVKKISLVGGYVNKLTLEDTEKNKKIFNFYPSEERLKLGYKLGEIDRIKDITSTEPFENWKQTEINKVINNNFFVAIFFNVENQNLSEKNYRQALAYSINKDDFKENRAISSISPGSWAFNSQVKPYYKDLDRAKELLSDAKDLKIVLSTASNLLNVAENIKKDWEEVGIQTEIQSVAGIPENYEALLITVDIPADPDQYVLWHSTQTLTNISKFKNDRIDKLLEDGRVQLIKEERKKSYLDFQRYLVEEVPAIFLYHPTFYTIIRK